MAEGSQADAPPTVSGRWARTAAATFVPATAIAALHAGAASSVSKAPIPIYGPWRAMLVAPIMTAANYHYWVEGGIQRGEDFWDAASWRHTVLFGATTPLAIFGAGLVTNSVANFASAAVQMVRRPGQMVRRHGHLVRVTVAQRAMYRIAEYCAMMGFYTACATPVMGIGAALAWFPFAPILHSTWRSSAATHQTTRDKAPHQRSSA